LPQVGAGQRQLAQSKRFAPFYVQKAFCRQSILYLSLAVFIFSAFSGNSH
jgi:hypothetical protein